MKEIEKANGDLGARLGDAESQLSSSLTEIRTLTENVYKLCILVHPMQLCYH